MPFNAAVQPTQDGLQARVVEAQNRLPHVQIDDDLRIRISAICGELDVDGLRGDIVTNRAARALAAFEGRTEVSEDDVARVAFQQEQLAAGRKQPEFQRLKGLGEMDWEELRETTMDPDRRTLLQVSLEQAAIADEITSILMGDDVDQRKSFIVSNAKDVRFLDI